MVVNNWLNENLTLNLDIVDSLLTEYFLLLNEESANINAKKGVLSEEVIDKIKSLYIEKIYLDKDKAEELTLTYREFFYLLMTVRDPLNTKVDDTDLATESFQITKFFYEKIEKKSTLNIKNKNA